MYKSFFIFLLRASCGNKLFPIEYSCYTSRSFYFRLSVQLIVRAIRLYQCRNSFRLSLLFTIARNEMLCSGARAQYIISWYLFGKGNLYNRFSEIFKKRNFLNYIIQSIYTQYTIIYNTCTHRQSIDIFRLVKELLFF